MDKQPGQPRQKINWQAALSRLDGAYSDATLRAYRADIEGFVGWCKTNKRRALPASPRTLAAFITDQTGKVAPSTIRRRLAAIRKIHRLMNMESPAGDEEVLIARRRAFRASPTRPHQALGLTRNLRNKLLDACPNSLLGKRDKAMIALGYDALCRRGELVALRFEDIVPSANGSAQILIRRSKSDPFGQGRSGYISPQALEILKSWKQAAKIESGYIFRRLTNGKVGRSPLHPFTVSRIIKSAAAKAGLPPQTVDDLSGHSMRVGAAQDMITSGMGILPIMRAGGWKTVHVVARYVEHADLEAIMSNVSLW
jgi:integrase